jgi:hypothetical protein
VHVCAHRRGVRAYYISFFRYALAILVKNLFHELRFLPCSGFFCPFGAEGSGRDVERQYGVQHDSYGMLFGVILGYTALILLLGYVALVLQLRSQLRRKPAVPPAPPASAAARVLGLPAHALAFAEPAAEAGSAGSAPERKGGVAGQLRRRFGRAR